MQLLTAREVAESFRVSAETVLKLAREDRIPHFRLGASVRFRPEDVDAWLQARHRTVEQPVSCHHRPSPFSGIRHEPSALGRVSRALVFVGVSS